MKIAKRYIDEIEKIVNHKVGQVSDIVMDHWWEGGLPQSLFGLCRPFSEKLTGCGCLTAVKDGQSKAFTSRLTLEIRKDPEIVGNHRKIAGRLSGMHFPLSPRDKTALRKKLLPYARWQTKMHCYRFKDIPRSEIVEVNERTGRRTKA